MTEQTITSPLEEVQKYCIIKSETFESVESLLEKVTWVSKLIGKNTVIPVFENILFRKGVMFASDLRIAAMAYTSIKGEFMVPGKSLLSILKNLEKSDLVSFANENQMLLLKVNGEETFRFNMCDKLDDFPDCSPKEISIVVGEFPSNTDIKTLKVACSYASNDPSRPAIECVYLNAEHIAATNGHWLLYSGVQDTMVHEEDYHILFPTKAIDLISDFEHASIKRDPENHRLLIKEKDRAIRFINIKETFPKYKDVIPKENHIKVKLSKEKFLDALKLGSVSANKTSWQMSLFLINGDNKVVLACKDTDFESSFRRNVPATIEWGPKKKFEFIPNGEKDEFGKSKGETIEKLVAPADKEEFIIGFNLKFMQKILGDVKSKDIEILMSAPNKAIIINNTVLVMPVMLG